MTLVLLVGGARSGKSTLAVRRASEDGASVFFVATAEAGDDEMADRIALHRRERPAEWETIEEPVELERALASVPGDAVAIVDCLSLWVSNIFERDVDVDDLASRAAAAAAARPGLTIAVTNEVGLGIVPDNALARRYRDVLGRVNAIWAAAAHETYFVVAGRTLRLD